ncbi:MAG: hypothetical protein ACN6ON_09855 [Sphingobacterium sp.]
MRNKHHILLKRIFGSLLLCVTTFNSFSQDWLPKQQDKKVVFRLLGCHYEGAKLKQSYVIGIHSDNWDVKQEVLKKKGDYAVTYRFVFKAKKAMKDVGVAAAFDAYDWSSDNFVMIPARLNLVQNPNWKSI